MTRYELENDALSILNDIKSEITCRKGQLYDGELSDAIRYLDDVKDILQQLDDDIYEEKLDR